MKNLKKLIIGVALASTFGCVSLTSIDANAIATWYWGELEDDNARYEWIMENGIEEAKFVVIDEGVTYNYYYDGNSINEYGVIPFILSEDDVEIPEDVEQIVTINFDNSTIEGCGDNGKIDEFDEYKQACFILVVEDYSYYQTGYFSNAGEVHWFRPESALQAIKKDDTTIGDSGSTPITEFTVGESTYPRGDINLDGKVNTLDLLMLKKYLLGLMEW